MYHVPNINISLDTINIEFILSYLIYKQNSQATSN